MNELQGILNSPAVGGVFAVLVILLAGLRVRLHERWLDWRCTAQAKHRRERVINSEAAKIYRLMYNLPTTEETAELRAWRVQHGYEKKVQP